MAAKDERLKMRLYEEESAPEAIMAKYGLDARDILDFSVNVNPFAPPAIVFDEAAKALEDCGVYPDLHLRDLRQTLSVRHGLEPGFFMFGAGLDDVLKLISQAWLGPSRTVLIHVPTFPRYELEARIVNAKPIYVASDPPWRIDIERISDAVRANTVDVAYLCTPNNPTGARIGIDDVEGLATSFPETRFVVDEALADPTLPGAMPLVGKYKNVVVLRTFSKYLGLAGLRVGYAVGHPESLSSLTSVRPPFNVSGFSAKIAKAALENDDFLSSSRLAFKAERDFMTAEIGKIAGLAVRGSCSNMMFISISATPISRLVGDLARRGIIVVDATSFRGLENTPSLRISLRTRPENARLLKALRSPMSPADAVFQRARSDERC